MALMGDPSLRLHMVYPVTQLTATQTETMIHLSWTASTDAAIIGYNVYRRRIAYVDSHLEYFKKLNASILASTTFMDSMPSLLPVNAYMVRAIKSEGTPSEVI